MGLNRAKDGKLLYHLTELKNLQSILMGDCSLGDNWNRVE